MAGKVTADEYKKVQDWLNQNYTQDSIKSYTSAYNDAKSKWKTTDEALNSSSGLLVKQSSWGTSWGNSWVSSGGVSGNSTSWWDVYGDVSKNATTSAPMDFSKYSWPQSLSQDNAIFGKDAEARERTNSWFISSRNDTIAYELKNKGITDSAKIEEYLNSTYNNFKNADATEKANTIRAISTRLSEIQKGNWTEEIKDETVITDANGNKTWLTAEEIDRQRAQAREWYYRNPDGTYYEIHWYQALCNAWYKTLIDWMTEDDKKYISNLWDKWMQDLVKTYLDNKRQQGQVQARQDIDTDLYNINRESSLIQASQTLRHARESYDNLKQNWQYLGNMWMPWVSATKIQAIGDAINEAEMTLNEINKLTKLSLDAQAKQWEGQLLQYTQQIQNLQYDLDWKVGKEIQALLWEFTTAELEWKLDTIDGITAFKKELMDKLNNNLTWITSASLDQMQYITKEYQDIADKMYEYAENQNKVNTEMSAVKWYYVDGNGNPIFNAKGETIQVPQSAPLDPIYDKETGKLIVFGYDENWQIVANIQNILGYENPYYTWKGTGLGNMRTERHNNPTAMTVDVARSLGMREWVDYIQGDSFVDSKGNTQYTAELIGDPIETTIRAFDNAAANGIGIFYTAKGGQRWTHTAMSNEEWMAMSDNQKRQTILKMLQREWGDINKMKFYNQWSSNNGNMEWDKEMEWYYKKFLKAEMTQSDWKNVGDVDEFKKQAKAYKDYVDGQVSEVAKDMLINLNDIYSWLVTEEGIDPRKYAQLVAWVYGDGRMYKKKLDQLKSSTALQKLIALKQDWATFGALSDQELWFITDASEWLDLLAWPENFVNRIGERMNTMLNYYWLTRADISKMWWASSWGNQNNNWWETTTVEEENIYAWGGRWAFGG